MKTAKELLQTLNLHDRSWGYDVNVTETKDGAFVDYRNHRYFTDNPYVEDDDFPAFTGKKEVINHVEFHLGKDLERFKVDVYDQEKGYFTVQLTKKKLK